MKGITAIIAVILLLLITIAMTGFAFVFFSRVTETAGKSAEEQAIQQIQQFGEKFRVEGVDKNRVYVRNSGSTSLSNLAFFVNSVQVGYSGPASLAPNTVGTYFLNDSQLSMLPDPATLRVTSAGNSDEIAADFYGNYDGGYWKFDEGNGLRAFDSSGNVNDLTIRGTIGPVVFNPWTPGVYGTALSINGNNQYARNSTGIGLPLGSSPRTFQAWIKPAGYPDVTYNGIAAYGSMACTSLGSMLSIQNSGRLSHAFWCNDAIQTTGTAAVLDNWTHVMFTYSGGTTVKFYMNGQFVQEVTLSGGVPAATVDGPIRIGCTDDPGRCFNGAIDEVRVFNVARTMTTA